MIGTLLLAFHLALSTPLRNHAFQGATRYVALKSFSADCAEGPQPQPQPQPQQQPYKGLDDDGDHPIGLYVHIPYCRRRCRYCNFAILPIGPNVDTDVNRNQETSFDTMNRNYLNALLTELKTISPKEQIRLKSIYFGGGTPSLAPVDTIAEILKAVSGRGDSPFVLEPNAEVSIEMDPGTFSTEKLKALKELGINRISLGVQSFDDKILETMGRVHRRADVFSALNSIKTVFGDANYSLDLISGVPGLTPAGWIETLQTAVTLNPRPKHLSIYDLQLEEGTVFSAWYGSGQETQFPLLPSEEDSAFMYKYAAGYLRAKNYEHYEVSSYAYLTTEDTSVFRSQHNQIYWEPSSSWYALGLGATSFVDGKTVARPKRLVDYLAWVNDDRNGEPDDKDEQGYLTDIIMKRLRTSDGLDLQWIRERFGKDIVASIIRGAQLGLDLGFAEIVEPHDEGRILRLKDPEGLLYSNYIISSVFAEL
jgi:putative oxygen-independent coproporphyrinogen III oxidase